MDRQTKWFLWHKCKVAKLNRRNPQILLSALDLPWTQLSALDLPWTPPAQRMEAIIAFVSYNKIMKNQTFMLWYISNLNPLKKYQTKLATNLCTSSFLLHKESGTTATFSSCRVLATLKSKCNTRIPKLPKWSFLLAIFVPFHIFFFMCPLLCLNLLMTRWWIGKFP